MACEPIELRASERFRYQYREVFVCVNDVMFDGLVDAEESRESACKERRERFLRLSLSTSRLVYQVQLGHA
jgi:hypothetical protein